MEVGDTVMIWQDPVTQETPEGEATLLYHHWTRGNTQYWQVRFVSDGYKCERFIHPVKQEENNANQIQEKR